MRVTNMTGRTGKPVANQFVIKANKIPVYFEEKQSDLLRYGNYTHYKQGFGHCYSISSGDLFQSYKSTVALIDYVGRKFIDHRYYKYSKTTSKYLSQFFEMTSEEIEQAIKAGDIRLCEIWQS